MANSQHQNGASEILIKLVKGVKKSLIHAMGGTKFSLNILLLEISNLVNERPIGVKPNSKSASDYLSPNSLLLGRSTARISAGPFQAEQIFTDDPQAAKTRFLLVQAITDQFWKVWLRVYFPTLLVRQKWHVGKRNLMDGDICLMKDSNAFRCEWRLCEVSKVFPDANGCVRNVQVKVKAIQGGSLKYVPTKPIHINRHVNNLLVLVPAGERQELVELQRGPKTSDEQVGADGHDEGHDSDFSQGEESDKVSAHGQSDQHCEEDDSVGNKVED